MLERTEQQVAVESVRQKAKAMAAAMKRGGGPPGGMGMGGPPEMQKMRETNVEEGSLTS